VLGSGRGPASQYITVHYSIQYDKVPETKKLFSLIFTVFAIWKHLEADCFAILHRFDTEKTNQRKQLNFQMLPKLFQ